jgi:mRNA interferase RelE/StbE
MACGGFCFKNVDFYFVILYNILIGGILMEVMLFKKAQKELEKLNEPDFSRIIKGLDYLANEPSRGDIKRLMGKDDLYRLRVGDYRIIFRYAEKISGEKFIIVDKIRLRGQAYKGD